MNSTMLHKPEAGQSSEVAIKPGQTYLFDFVSESVTYDTQAADVVLAFDDGAVLRLRDFLRVAAHDDFTIELSDGVQLSGRDVADMFNMVLTDFHTDSPAPVADEGADRAGGSALLVGERDLSGLLGQEEFAPQCLETCRIPEHEHNGFSDPGPLITPHAAFGFTPLFTPVNDTIENGAAPLPGHPQQSGPILPGDAGGVLQIEDLLDTTRPVIPEPPPPPAFESLLDAPRTNFYFGPEPESVCDRNSPDADRIAQADGTEQDPFLLALLSLGQL